MKRLNQRRSAFTLVELLIVIAIITLIAGLLMSAVSATRTSQQVEATRDIVIKLQTGIDNQVKILNDQTREDRRKRTPAYTSLVTYCGGDEDRAEALLMYCKLRHAFPQTYAEATTNLTLTVGATTYLNWPPHKAYMGMTNVSGWSAETQSAALLYVALSSMGAGGNSFDLDATNSAQIDYTENNVTARVFRDAWSNPVGFKRFLSAVVMPELNQSPYANPKFPNLKDPWDNQAKLSTLSANWTLAFKSAAEAQVFVAGSSGAFDNNMKSITAFAAGKDKTYNTPDDLLGYQLRKQGSKGGAP